MFTSESQICLEVVGSCGMGALVSSPTKLRSICWFILSPYTTVIMLIDDFELHEKKLDCSVHRLYC